jgi:polysaccharide deacetylase family protein (PEP-CTERM system associated)
MKKFVFSIDIEDWFQVENLKGQIRYTQWPEKECRIDLSTRIVLNILKKRSIRATFFVLGWIAERKPALIREIASQGHEIASHGYKHEMLHTIDEKILEFDIQKSLEILQPLARNRIIGYRAPSFSITKAATRILRQLNFAYDASLNDFQFNRRYGKIVTSGKTSRIGGSSVDYSILENGLIEFPISVNTYFSVYWPIGGGYFRLSPTWFIKRQLRDIFRQHDIASIYLHPWEFDPGQPHLKSIGVNYYLRHYFGVENTAKKFDFLLALIENTPNVEIKTFGDIVKNFVSINESQNTERQE